MAGIKSKPEDTYIKVRDVFDYLCEIAPMDKKTDYDNIGLLLGRSDRFLSKILLSLDITSEVISEAIDNEANLIVSHHPLFFTLDKINDLDLRSPKN